MDKHSFDAVARALTSQQPRRTMIRLLGVAAIPALATRLPAEEAQARKKRKHKKKKKGNKLRCPSDQTVCRGACIEPDIVCCPASTDGQNATGLCPASHPSCCSLSVFGGCCPAEFPVCCAEDCCAADETCDEDGFCIPIS